MKPLFERTDEELLAYMKEHDSCIAWDILKERGKLPPDVNRPVGPSKEASIYCQSGKRDWCTCDTCW